MELSRYGITPHVSFENANFGQTTPRATSDMREAAGYYVKLQPNATPSTVQYLLGVSNYIFIFSKGRFTHFRSPTTELWSLTMKGRTGTLRPSMIWPRNFISLERGVFCIFQVKCPYYLWEMIVYCTVKSFTSQLRTSIWRNNSNNTGIVRVPRLSNRWRWCVCFFFRCKKSQEVLMGQRLGARVENIRRRRDQKISKYNARSHVWRQTWLWRRCPIEPQNLSGKIFASFSGKFRETEFVYWSRDINFSAKFRV